MPAISCFQLLLLLLLYFTLLSHSWDARLLISHASRSCCCCCCCQLIAWVILGAQRVSSWDNNKNNNNNISMPFWVLSLAVSPSQGAGNKPQAASCQLLAASGKRQLQQIATPKVLLPLSHFNVAFGMLFAFYFILLLYFFGFRLTRWHNNGLAGGSEHDIWYRQAYT